MEMALNKNNSHEPAQLLDTTYSDRIIEGLLREIRPQDRNILDVGCGDGRFGRRIKDKRSDVVVIGVEADATAASLALEVLDTVYALNIEVETLPIAVGTIDCIILDKSLQTARNPEDVLRKLIPLLSPNGRIVAVISNAQHFETLASLIAGDIQMRNTGPLHRNNLHLLGAANIQKLFLDSGLMPHFTSVVGNEVPPGMAEALLPIIKHLQLNPDFFLHKLAIQEYICTGDIMDMAQVSHRSITFVAAVNNTRQFQDNLLASPIFRNGRHEIIPVTGAKSAADALRIGLGRATEVKDLIVLLHQDIYLPEGWDDKLIAGIETSERTSGPVGIAGVFGVVQTSTGTFERAGKVLDRHNTLETKHRFPALATSLDEIVLAFPVRNSAIAGLEPDLGFHMYGSEVCLKVRDVGETAIIVDAPCLHNSESGYQLDQAFAKSAQIFSSRRKANFPYATTCVKFDNEGQATVW